MSYKTDLKQLLKPYYWFNILLSLSYVTCKRTGYICNFLFPSADCELDSRETEILFFLIIVVMLRTRKAGSVTMVNYLSSSFVYTKIANLILWFYADIRYGLPYGAILILSALLLPEPTYMGPEHVTYFRGPQVLEDELKHHKNTTWIVCLYAAWHPACVNFAPVFAELSASYGLDNLKFGKLDVGRYPESAAKYRVQDGPTSRQLPTVLVLADGQEKMRRPQADHTGKLQKYPESAAKYQVQDGPTSRQLPTVLVLADGQEKMRRPQADHTGKLQKFLFSKDNVKAAFDLDGIYQECKKKLANAKNVKKDE